MKQPTVRLRGLEKRFGRRRVLRGLDLDLPAGSVTALLGANGEGKSTLCSILTGLMPRDGGELHVLGLDPKRRGAKLRARIGFVPERQELPRWMKVGEALRFHERFYPTWSRTEEQRLVQLLGLERGQKAGALSKGGRAKLALTLALAHEPELLILDEPFGGLDPGVRREVLSAVLGHLADEGRTVLVVSHATSELERLADRVAILKHGRIALSGGMEERLADFTRLAAQLESPVADWSPPGAPRLERDGAEVLVTYTEGGTDAERAMDEDPAVRALRRLPADLEEFFLELDRQEDATCSAS